MSNQIAIQALLLVIDNSINNALDDNEPLYQERMAISLSTTHSLFKIGKGCFGSGRLDGTTLLGHLLWTVPMEMHSNASSVPMYNLCLALIS